MTEKELYFNNLKKIRRCGGHGQYQALCPFHNDKNPSFSFNELDWVWICYAGCGSGDAADFAEKIGIDPKQFYKSTKSMNYSYVKISDQDKTNLYEKLPKKYQDESMRYWKYLKNNFDKILIPECWTEPGISLTFTGYDSNKKRIVFKHTDSDGFAVNLRRHKGLDGSDGYSIKGYGKTRLYPLHILYDCYDFDTLLVICEGEKDCVTAISHNIQAVAATNGALSIPEDLTPIYGFNKYYIVYDNDDAGINGAVKFKAALKSALPDSDIFIHKWSEQYPQGYDITDYFEEGHSKEEFELMIKKGSETIEIQPEIHHTSHTSHTSMGGLPNKIAYETFNPSIDYNVLTPALTEYLDKVKNTTDAPDEFLLTAFLGCWAGVVGNKLFIKNQSLRPNLWFTCFAGSSKVRKSTAINTARKSFDKAQKGLDESRKIILSSDFSDAGFYEMMKNNSVSGTIIATEFADFHRKLNREYCGLSDAFLSAYDNERMQRVTRENGCEVIEEPTFSILGATTYANFNKVFTATESENGFLQRLLPVCITNPTKERILLLDRICIDETYIDSLANKINYWLNAEDKEVLISEEVKQIFTEWDLSFYDKSVSKYGEKIIPIIERMIPSCLKIGMLDQSLIDLTSDEKSIELKKESLICAQMLIENIYLPSMNYLIENEITAPHIKDEKKIEKAIKENGGSIYRAELLRKIRLPSKELNMRIESLEEKGMIKIENEEVERAQGGGKQKQIINWLKD